MSTLPKLQTSQLVGHADEIICLAAGKLHSPFTGKVLSGSADGTARLWDTRLNTYNHASVTINNGAADEVTAVCFAEPYLPDRKFDVEPSNQPSEERKPQLYTQDDFALFDRSCTTVFVAYNNTVYEYDLRMASNGALSQHIAVSSEFPDEISYITYSPNGREVCVCNDDGTISFIPTYNTPVHVPTMSASHAGNVCGQLNVDYMCEGGHGSICGTAVYSALHPLIRSHTLDSNAYRPSSVIFSGGLDCNINAWTNTHNHNNNNNRDNDNNKQSIDSYLPIQTISTSSLDTGGQLFNPPLVHSLAISPLSSLLIAGQGDGCISLFDVGMSWSDDICKRMKEWDKMHSYRMGDNNKQHKMVDKSTLLTQRQVLQSAMMSVGVSHEPLRYLTSVKGHTYSITNVVIPVLAANQSNYNTASLSRLLAGNSTRAHDKIFMNTSAYSLASLRRSSSSSSSSDEYSTSHHALSSTLTSLVREYSTRLSNKQHTPSYSDVDIAVTAGLDCALVVWKGLGSEARSAYVQQQQQQQQQSKLAKLKKIVKQAQHMQIQGTLEDNVDDINELLQHQQEEKQPLRELRSGWYKKADEATKSMLSDDLIHLRLPLVGKPNCMCVGVDGWAWVGGASNKISGYNILQ